MSFVQRFADSCLFTRKEKENFTYIIVYIDNILIASKNEIIQKIINYPHKEYGVKDFSEISHYLGTNIIKTDDGFKLNQNKKIDDLARKLNLKDARPNSTLMKPGFKI